jgi:hypothetical protein
MALLMTRRRRPTLDELADRREAELEAAETAARNARMEALRQEAARRAADERRTALARLDRSVDELLDVTDGMTQAEVRDALRADRNRWARPFAGAPLDDVLAAVIRRDPRAGRDRVVLLARAAGCRGSQAELHAAYRRLCPAGPTPAAL